ncbi:MAG: response regulator transcription factor [Chitinophagaceae bacterium]
MSTPLNKDIINIALIDDHTLLRSGLASLINSFNGYHVSFEADHGKEFIAMLDIYGPPDIVLLDITMPEMNGYETAAWIKKNVPSIKILVLSMSDSETSIITMIKAGAGGYILKDSKPAVFRQALDDIRDKGIFMNDLVSNKMLSYVKGEEKNKDVDILSRLSEKELAFLKLACTEKTYKEIGSEMNLSPRTVEGYRDELFEKLKVSSRVGLVLFAIKNGLHKL